MNRKQIRRRGLGIYKTKRKGDAGAFGNPVSRKCKSHKFERKGWVHTHCIRCGAKQDPRLTQSKKEKRALKTALNKVFRKR